jgi:DNA-binding Lrp family transcriptional regulator
MKVLPSEGVEQKQIVLDAKDKHIIALEAINARLPISVLAKEIRLSRDAVKYRIQRMEKEHVLVGSRSVVNVRKLGFSSYHVFFQMQFASQLKEKEFIDVLKKHPNVNAVIKYRGKWDYEVAIMVRSPAEFDTVLKEITLKIGTIQDYEILVLLDTFVSQVYPEVSLDRQKFIENYKKNDSSFIKDFQKKETGYAIDDKDKSLIRILASDANVPFLQLGSRVGLSDDAVCYRIRKLVRNGYISSFIPIVDYSALGLSIQAVLFKLQNFSAEKEKEFTSFLRQHKNVVWGARCIGRWNIITYFLIKDLEEFHKALDSVMNRFRDNIQGTEILFAYEEYKYSYTCEAVV